jgi:ATP adenylyltransferase
VQHEQIWAPWRLGYIIGDKDVPREQQAPTLGDGASPACFLCQCAAPGDDRGRVVVHRSQHVVTLLNRYPYNNGHLLVAPRMHVGRLDRLPDDVQLELSRTVTRMVGLLEELLNPQGFNVGLNLGREAGAGVPDHLHWHIVPRWAGDTNFMPVLAGVRVIPQSLEALWEALAERLGGGCEEKQ